MSDMQISRLFDQMIPFLNEHKYEENAKNFLFSLLLFRLESIRAGSESIAFPPQLTWEELRKNRNGLKHQLCHALHMLEEAKPKYRGILYPDSLEEFQDQEISAVFDIIGELPTDQGEKAERELVHFYEIIAGHMAPESSKQMGEYNTPRMVGDLMVKLLEPEGGSIYDPCCGSGSILTSAADYLRKKNRRFQLYGQEANESAWKAARVNLILRGIDGDLGEIPADSIRQDMHPELKADYVLGNPPFHGAGWSQRLPEGDIRWKYGIPSPKKGDFAWMQHMLYHLKEDGKMGAIFSNGILNSRRTKDIRIRAGILQEDMLEAIITLPAGMFYATKVSVSLWIFRKQKKAVCRNKILLVDARKFGRTENGITVLSEEEQKELIQIYQDYQDGIHREQWKFCRQISVSEVEGEDFSLAPERYIARKKQSLPESKELEKREYELELRLRNLLEENQTVLRQISHERQPIRVE